MTLLRRIGLLGDIHAQDRALAAALEYLAVANVDAILAVGDIVDGSGDADRCCELLGAAAAHAVRGNHDRWFLRGPSWTAADATPASGLTEFSRRFLAGLHVEESFVTSAGSLLLCHSLGSNDMDCFFDHFTDDEILAIPHARALVDSGVRFVVHGHTHQRLVRRVGRTTFINAGTLAPNDRPCFAVVDFERGFVQFLDLDGECGITEADRSDFPGRLPDEPGARDNPPTRALAPTPPQGLARSRSSVAAATEWEARVIYREPRYEMERGNPPTEFGRTYRVEAVSESSARELALEAFGREGREQTVGWGREVVRVECSRVKHTPT